MVMLKPFTILRPLVVLLAYVQAVGRRTSGPALGKWELSNALLARIGSLVAPCP